MVRINSIIFLLLFGNCASQFCASTFKAKEEKADTVDCSVAKTSYLLPSISDISQYTEYKCNVVFILDLGSEFVSQIDYQIVMIFIDHVATNCMKKGIGFQVTVYPMFNKAASMTCCSIRMCEQAIGFMNYDIYVPPYGNKDPIVDEDDSTYFTDTIVNELKTVNAAGACAYNTAILMSNRLFRAYDLDALNLEMEQIADVECLTFSQVIFGRGDDITQAQVDKLYGGFSDYQYLVPNVNCLDKISACIAPCGSMTPEECSALDLTTCDYPTLPTTPSSTSTTTPGPEFATYWHIIYVFAISNRTTNEQFNNIVEYIGNPIMECKVRPTLDKNELLVRFLAPLGEDSQWISDLSTVDSYLNEIRYDEIVVPGGPEAYDKETSDLMWKALGITTVFDGGSKTPRITLVSDFASQTFIDQYQTNFNNLLLLLGKYDVQIITFSEEVAEIYRNHSFKANDIHVDVDFDPSHPIPLCPPNPTGYVKFPDGPSTTTILLIIIGSCLGLMMLLVVATIVFRQKYIWMERLHAMKREGITFTDSHGHDDDIIDYWEISWDDLIVKNDRLGHGAHGQVFRGKLRGSSPGVEHFFKPEDRMNYVNCDVAIKMLPSAASDRAREEFLREIDMMKSMGYNEHIVNMLGCITTHKRLGLVLEYCAQGDLSRILKVKKADLEVTRSIDNQIDCTKQFLQYAWQVAHGMEFLQKQGIIHRDLAARNVLVDYWGNAKVADFGLCIRSDEHLSPPTTPTTPTDKERSLSVTAVEGRLPIKWLAIECLQYHKFTHKSDVWSYGIVLFEMYSLGELPFSDIDPSELLDYLLGGGRPPRPLISCDKIYEVMTRCWNDNPDERPTFRELLTILAILIEQSTEGYGYLQLIKPSEYKTLTVPESVEKKRSGTGASNRSGAEKEKDKFMQPWKKLAATLKARAVFAPSSSAATATPAPPQSTSQNVPTISIQEPSTSTGTDVISNRIAPDLVSRLRSKVSFRQANELSVSNHDLPSTSTENGAREKPPAITRSTPRLNLFVNSRILGKNLSAVPQLTNDTPEVNRVKFMPNGYDRTVSCRLLLPSRSASMVIPLQFPFHSRGVEDLRSSLYRLKWTKSGRKAVEVTAKKGWIIWEDGRSIVDQSLVVNRCPIGHQWRVEEDPIHSRQRDPMIRAPLHAKSVGYHENYQ
ncbi:hypothetical protein PRIPAC_75409 [Pristionchus pacificus]|uniref:Protein kinase domain-containing protein n=1 Tax=Pristionchus pacificus TaxID=54126 RepID=A0A2A6CRG6_PRIPA|nr:hypothetical protein PRIPAC_75409 [Pristionchus pacificus]|eukprot:PDM80688.1 protein kinase [Pristionchus pacificus]